MFVKGPSSSQKKTSLKMQLKDEKKEIRNWKMSHLSLKKNNLNNDYCSETITPVSQGKWIH